MADVTTPAVVSVPLKLAALCLDDDEIFPLAHVGQDDVLHQVKACPKCGTTAFVPLERFFFGGGERTVVRLDDVIHEAGNGLTPARVRAEKLVEVLADFGRYPIIQRLASAHAQQIIQAVDETMRRLRALAGSERSDT